MNGETSKQPEPEQVDSAWGDLVVAILSVSNWSVEATYRHFDGLRRNGLFDPLKLAGWSPREIARRLTASGYNRGEFMANLFAERLANLGQFVAERGVDACHRVLAGQDIKAVESLLLPVKGVGPKVIENFCLLRELTENK